MSVNEAQGKLSAKGLKIGIVISRFNSFFTRQLLSGATDCILRQGGAEENVGVYWAPGANEIPMVAKKLAASGKWDAVIAIGVVIEGATPHADLINSQVSRSLAAIALEHGVPVINGVVCAHNLEQAVERSGAKAGNKGADAAQAAIEMVNLYKEME
ncbi:MAG: 6,7-dimethyl-8-ribityllumazine synthase [Verrucomicrobiota bacterium]|nr:6,7-dimethyl-8-ribityllumazine synthase [Verrucomicrobiota bacterium]